MATERSVQIGEAAELVGLSIRTIRHYDELGLVEPSGRSPGGFRLYTDADVERLALVKRLKPLQFSLEEIQELLGLLDAVGSEAQPDDLARLAEFVALAEDRCEQLRHRLAVAEDVTTQLRDAVPISSRRR